VRRLVVLRSSTAVADRRRAGYFRGLLQRWLPIIVPRVLASSVFLAGAMLLLSGAMPASHVRLQVLRRVLPLSLIELSHFLARIEGLLLMVLARGLQRRIDSAYYLTALVLISGAVLSLLKGMDVVEAVILAVMLAVLLPCRRHFYRQGVLLTERFTFRWCVAIAIVMACAVWLALFAYGQLEYSDELWWRFALDQDAPHSLRAVAGAVLTVFILTATGLLRAKPRLPGMPTREDLQAAQVIVATSPDASANLALLGDKHFLFNKERTALVMYGIEGRSWVSLGDPLGEPLAARQLAWDFVELCDAGGRWPVFYKVDEDRLSMYVEMGLAVIKLGEEGRLPLADFTLEGRARRHLREINNHLLEESCTFEIVEPEINDALLAELKAVSDAWLAERNTAEKGFSLGSFEPDYVRRFAIALVRREGRAIAFANVTRGFERKELSGELMRYLPDAPSDVMSFLFIQLMLWGRQHGFEWFNLGMAPLSGIEAQPLAPLWNRVAAVLYHHGEHFYHFQGLREYKEKFHPVWRPKYLATRGGIALPVVMANVVTLISGGLKRLVMQ
jgi:phosphatidylglycerol lysyltransferase